jgi:hypothetical protein
MAREALAAKEDAAFVDGSNDMYIEACVDSAGDLSCQSGHRHPFVLKAGGVKPHLRTTDKRAACGQLLTY